MPAFGQKPRTKRPPNLDALLGPWVSTTSHYNSGEAVEFVSGISMRRGWQDRFPSAGDCLETRTGRPNGHRSIVLEPGNKRPGEEQSQRHENSIAVRAIEPIRLREQFGSAAEQGSPGDYEEAAENVKAHDVANAQG